MNRFDVLWYCEEWTGWKALDDWFLIDTCVTVVVLGHVGVSDCSARTDRTVASTL